MMMGLVCRISVLQVAKKVPNLKIEYAVDSRQQIADSWPMVRSCCWWCCYASMTSKYWKSMLKPVMILTNLSRCLMTPLRDKIGAGSIGSVLSSSWTSWSPIWGQDHLHDDKDFPDHDDDHLISNINYIWHCVSTSAWFCPTTAAKFLRLVGCFKSR